MIKSLFSCDIFNGEIPNFNEINPILLTRGKELKEQQTKLNTIWLCDTYNTVGLDWKLNNKEDDIIQQMFIQPIANGVANLANHSLDVNIDNVNIFLQSLWWNFASPGDYQEFHTHEDSHYSFVYYVKAPKKSGLTCFQNPLKGDMTIPEAGSQQWGACYNDDNREGKFVIFRSNILHMAMKNKSEEERITISGNFKIERK